MRGPRAQAHHYSTVVQNYEETADFICASNKFSIGFDGNIWKRSMFAQLPEHQVLLVQILCYIFTNTGPNNSMVAVEAHDAVAMIKNRFHLNFQQFYAFFYCHLVSHAALLSITSCVHSVGKTLHTIQLACSSGLSPGLRPALSICNAQSNV